MKALTHTTDGRTVIRALLIAVVLTAGIAGTVGTAAAAPLDGKGNDPLSLDGPGDDVPTESLGGAGDDAVTDAVPINNVTVSADYAGRGGGSGTPSF